MTSIIKKVLLCVLSSAMLISAANAMADDEIKIVINNQEIYTEDKPVIVNGRTMLPLRAIGEAMGCEVVWVQATSTANLKNDTTIISMQIGNTNISRVKRTNLERKLLLTDVPPMLINDKTYIPVRAFAEALDAVVGWDSTTNTVMIVYDTTLKYAGNYSVDTYAGNGERQKHDSTYQAMSFISPEGITVNDKGEVLIADSGLIRKLANGRSETIEFEPEYITASLVRCCKDDVYILTNEFQNSDGIKYYGIIKLNGSEAEGIFITEANYSSISDFDISNDGKIYVLYNNAILGKSYLGRLDPETSDINYVTEIDDGIKALSIDDSGNIFLGNTVKGSIYFYNTKTDSMKLFAGADNKTKFVDGPNPMFFEPRRLDCKDGYLYVLDYNIVRRIGIDGAGQAISAETLAGKVSVEQNPDTVNGKGSDITFAPSYLMDMAVTDEGILLTDPKNAVIRIIK